MHTAIPLWNIIFMAQATRTTKSIKVSLIWKITFFAVWQRVIWDWISSLSILFQDPFLRCWVILDNTWLFAALMQSRSAYFDDTKLILLKSFSSAVEIVCIFEFVASFFDASSKVCSVNLKSTYPQMLKTIKVFDINLKFHGKWHQKWTKRIL